MKGSQKFSVSFLVVLLKHLCFDTLTPEQVKGKQLTSGFPSYHLGCQGSCCLKSILLPSSLSFDWLLILSRLPHRPNLVDINKPHTYHYSVIKLVIKSLNLKLHQSNTLPLMVVFCVCPLSLNSNCHCQNRALPHLPETLHRCWLVILV